MSNPTALSAALEAMEKEIEKLKRDAEWAAAEAQALILSHEGHIERQKAHIEVLNGTINEYENDSACLPEDMSITETVEGLYALLAVAVTLIERGLEKEPCYPEGCGKCPVDAGGVCDEVEFLEKAKAYLPE